MNQPFDVLRPRFYVASQSMRYLYHLKHIYISKKKSYKDWRKQTPYTQNVISVRSQLNFWHGNYLIFTLMDSEHSGITIIYLTGLLSPM